MPDVRQTLGFTMEEAAVIDTPIAGLRGWAWLGMAGHGWAWLRPAGPLGQTTRDIAVFQVHWDTLETQ